MFFLLLILVATIIYFVAGIKIVQQEEAMIIERLGAYKKVLYAGFHLIVPFFEYPRKIQWKYSQKGEQGRTYSYYGERTIIDLRESVMDIPRQNVITKDNVSISINALIYFQIMDAKSAVYRIQNLPEAIEKLTLTTMRNVIGDMVLDETLSSRDTINTKLRETLDEASNKWGVKVNRIELQEITPPADVQASMEKQVKAEREKRAAIYEAEGQKQAAILKAEGEKESAINKAEGQKQAAILKAEGEKEAARLVAEGQAVARVRQAEAEAIAIQKTIEAIQEHGQPDKYLIAVRYLEAMKEMVSGENNKVVYMPYEATGILSSVDGIKQMLDGTKQ
jgi:regulator of protease activity HflC (stomatin/prohibitin superfamily)